MKNLSLIALAIVGLSAHAQPSVPFQPAIEANLAGRATSASDCTFLDDKLPPDTIVIAAGGYSGRRLAFQIDSSGHEATQFDVAVHADKPVALLLGAYEPTIWNIGWTAGTRIVAVFTTGYHRQAVAGLPARTPVINSTYDAKGACGYNYFSSDSGLGWVNPKARSVFGKDAARVYNRHTNGLIDIVESAAPKKAYTTSPSVTPESFRDKTAPLAGKAGLDDAVAKGILRRATAADEALVTDAYVKRAEAASGGKRDIPPVAGAKDSGPAHMTRVHMYEAYVVLKAFTYPAGLYGGHSATFIVPNGVPKPTGKSGHSTIFDLSSPTLCDGPGCPRAGY